MIHFRETYIKQDLGESPNDRNDRAIRVGTAWYVKRLPQMKIFLLTNDAENRRKALSNHLDAMSVQVSLLLVCGAIIQQQGAFLSCPWCLWCPVCRPACGAHGARGAQCACPACGAHGACGACGVAVIQQQCARCSASLSAQVGVGIDQFSCSCAQKPAPKKTHTTFVV